MVPLLPKKEPGEGQKFLYVYIPFILYLDYFE